LWRAARWPRRRSGPAVLDRCAGSQGQAYQRPAQGIEFLVCPRDGGERRLMMAEVQTNGRGEVSIRDLSKSFSLNGRDLNVLRGIDLDVGSGQCVAIVGASGAGKTALLRILAGLEPADGGDVLIDGAPIHGVGSDRAVIFQEPRLLPWLTV